jgi:hypothetical protein
MLRPASEPAVGVASAEPSASAAVAAPTASTSLAPSATEEPTQQPTPQPTPAGPPQELAVDGWATVTVGELNVRSEPGLDASSVYRLVRGAIAHVAEGPASADGYNWYRIASLGGARGWATSGTTASPFLETVTRGGDLVQCGQVIAPVFAEGTLTPVEVIRVGDMALPPAAFEPGELGGFALARGTSQEVCVTAVRGDPSPTVYVEMSHAGCGHPVVSGDRLEFHPMAGMDVVAEYQHKDVVRIHPAVLDPKGKDDALTDNMIAILQWMSLDPRSWGCLMQGVHESPDREVGGIQLDIRGCGVIESQTADRVTVRAAAGTDQAITLTLTPESTVDPALPTGVPVGMIAWGFDDLNMRSISLAPYDAPCP